MNYPVREFSIPDVAGLSPESITEHLGLYKGYVTNTNKVLEAMSNTSDIDSYAVAEMQRRLSFEFNGMKNHEYYFEQLEGGPNSSEDCPFKAQTEKQYGSWDNWAADIKRIAKTRGVGWAVTYFDPTSGELINSWVDEQHLGHLNSLQFIFGIDMWEHSFVADYQPSGKGRYIDDYVSAVNWDVVGGRLRKALASCSDCDCTCPAA